MAVWNEVDVSRRETESLLFVGIAFAYNEKFTGHA